MTSGWALSLETTFHHDYDPETYQARQHERVDIGITVRNGKLRILIGAPFLVELTVECPPDQVADHLGDLVKSSQITDTEKTE